MQPKARNMLPLLFGSNGGLITAESLLLNTPAGKQTN